MKSNVIHYMLQIEARISELQRSNIRLQEQLKEDQNNFEYVLNDAALRIIDILDMITMVEPNIGLDNGTKAQLVIRKIEKRLVDVLRHWQVQEIVFKDDQIETDKIRVLATRPVSGDLPAGTIIEVCRKGYQRNGKTIRPVDVISTVNTQ